MEVEMENNVAIVHTPPRLMGKMVNEMLIAVKEAHKKGAHQITIDLSVTEFIDSSGIGSLVSLTKEFKKDGPTFSLRRLKPEINELFADTGLDLIFNIQTDKGIDAAKVDIFDTSVDIRLEIRQESDDDMCILHLGGVMNHPVGSRFFKQQFLLTMAAHKKIILDLDELTFFDSLSVSVILNMNKLLKETGGSLRMCSANYIVGDLFTTLNIKQIVPIFDNLAQAKANWNIT